MKRRTQSPGAKSPSGPEMKGHLMEEALKKVRGNGAKLKLVMNPPSVMKALTGRRINLTQMWSTGSFERYTNISGFPLTTLFF